MGQNVGPSWGTVVSPKWRVGILGQKMVQSPGGRDEAGEQFYACSACGLEPDAVVCACACLCASGGNVCALEFAGLPEH